MTHFLKIPYLKVGRVPDQTLSNLLVRPTILFNVSVLDRALSFVLTRDAVGVDALHLHLLLALLDGVGVVVVLGLHNPVGEALGDLVSEGDAVAIAVIAADALPSGVLGPVDLLLGTLVTHGVVVR